MQAVEPAGEGPQVEQDDDDQQSEQREGPGHGAYDSSFSRVNRPRTWSAGVLTDTSLPVGDRLVDRDHTLRDRFPVVARRPRVGGVAQGVPGGGVREQLEHVARQIGRVLAVEQPARFAALEHLAGTPRCRSRATGVPAAIASSRTMPKLSPPVFGRDVDVHGGKHSGLVLVADQPEEGARGRAMLAGRSSRTSSTSPGPATRSCTSGARATIAGRAAEQDRQTLARLVDAPEEPQPAPPSAPGQPASRFAPAEGPQRHPVGDQDRVATEVLDERRRGRARSPRSAR